MSTPKPTRKATIAVFGGSGDYIFLQNFKLFFKFCKEANVHFSVESEKTEHGLTVNYAKYEYIEERHWVHGVEYGTHFIFIEFATWDDAMKAMWDGFSLEFGSIIFATQRKDPEGEYIFGHVEQILEAGQAHGNYQHTAWILNKDLKAARDVEMGEEEYRFIKDHFRTERFHLIRAPPVEKWNQTEDILESEWHSELHRYLTTIPTVEPDTSLDAESHWKFEETDRKTGRGTNFRAEIYVLPEDEGGAPIAAGDRLTFTDGPYDVEGTLSAFYEIRTTVSPRRVQTMMVDVDEPLEYLDLRRRFTVKKDGKFVALGILDYWGR